MTLGGSLLQHLIVDNVSTIMPLSQFVDTMNAYCFLITSIFLLIFSLCIHNFYFHENKRKESIKKIKNYLFPTVHQQCDSCRLGCHKRRHTCMQSSNKRFSNEIHFKIQILCMAWMHDFNDNMQLKLFNLRKHANLNMTKV